MIILYESYEKEFNNMGIGVLTDATECIVKEGLNGAFEMEMHYPMTGKHFNEIKNRRFLLVKPNHIDRAQPFRIYSISKPIDGIITVKGEHISYDLVGYTVTPFESENLQDSFTKIKEHSVIPNKFEFFTDKVNIDSGMKTLAPYSMRSLLAGQEGSLLDTYKGEYWFDMFDIHLLKNRGTDRGYTIRYGKNLTDIEQTLNSDKIYTGVYPFYQKETTETNTVTRKIYQKVYIMKDTKPWHTNWLTTSTILETATAILPIVENIYVQIKTEGEYFDKVIAFSKAKVPTPTLPIEDIRFLMINVNLLPDKDPEEMGSIVDSETDVIITPQTYTIYKIINEGEFKGKTLVFNEEDNKYDYYSGNGFYYEYDGPEETFPIPGFSETVAETVDKAFYVDLRPLPEDPEESPTPPNQNGSEEEDDDEVYSTPNGIIYIEGYEDDVDQRIMTLDLTNHFNYEPTQKELNIKAKDYLKHNNLREINNETTVSFIRLSDSPEYERFRSLEKVILGDKVRIIYERLDIETTLTVIETEYDVLTNKYIEISLGKKSSSISDTVITVGGPISELDNDVDFTNEQAVTHLIAKTITAEYIEAKDARLTQAQIKDLEVVQAKITGLLEASAADIDSIVTRLIIAENAEISKLLKAGEIEVAGDITIKSGEINLGEVYDVNGNVNHYRFTVDRMGNVYAESAEIRGDIKGGTININNNFKVSSDGTTEIKKGSIKIGQNFEVTNDGKMTAKEATIEGDINIKSGAIKIGDNFEVTNDGKMKAKEATIEGDIKINSGSIEIGENFEVTNDGVMKARGAIIQGSVVIDEGAISIGDNFTVQEDGIVYARAFNLLEESEIVEGQPQSSISISNGKLEAQEADIVGKFKTYDMYVEEAITFKESQVKISYAQINGKIVHERDVHFNVETTFISDYGIGYMVTISKIETATHFPKTTNSTHTVRVAISALASVINPDGTTSRRMTTGFDTVTFASGSAVNSYKSGIAIMGISGVYSDISVSVIPYYVTETTITGDNNDALGISADFAPINRSDPKLMSNGVFKLGGINNKWREVYANNGTIQTSDRNAKKDINYELEAFDKLFDSLKPASYKFIDSQSGRTHFGMIAQDVRDSLIELGIDTKEFAGYIKDKKAEFIFTDESEMSENDFLYGLRYDEFIALMIRQIQILKKEVKELKEK